jgi:predicted amidohydrolase
MTYESDIITIAVVNFKVHAGEKEKNVSRIIDYSVTAAKQGVDLILFPELCVVGSDYYLDKNVSRKEMEDITETIDGPTCKKIAHTAQKYGIYIVLGMAEKDKETGELYNSAFTAGPEGPMGMYRKIHPFDYENSWCKKGDTPFMFDTKWGPISIGICYDTYNFPELMRYYVSKGSRLYLNPSAVIEKVHLAESRQGFRDFYAPTIEYGVVCNVIYVASANLAGKDKERYFGGGSCIIGPKITPNAEEEAVYYYAGNVNNVQTGLSMATIDLSLATRFSFINNPYTGVPDYRPDVYKNFQ